MTDLARWDELIHTAVVCGGDYECQEDWKTEYVMIPLNDYQLGNLLGLLKRSGKHDNGDWFDEIISICIVTMRKMGWDSLENNFGDSFGPPDAVYDQVCNPSKCSPSNPA